MSGVVSVIDFAVEGILSAKRRRGNRHADAQSMLSVSDVEFWRAFDALSQGLFLQRPVIADVSYDMLLRRLDALSLDRLSNLAVGSGGFVHGALNARCEGKLVSVSFLAGKLFDEKVVVWLREFLEDVPIAFWKRIGHRYSGGDTFDGWIGSIRSWMELDGVEVAVMVFDDWLVFLGEKSRRNSFEYSRRKERMSSPRLEVK